MTIFGRILAVGFIFALSSIVSAFADEPQLKASGLKIAGDKTKTRIVLGYDKSFKPKWFLLREPYRVVIDMPRTAFAIDLDNVASHGLVSIVRYGQFDDDQSRIIIGGQTPFVVENIDVLANEDGEGHRLAVDLVAASQITFEQALSQQSGLGVTVRTAPKNDRLGASYRDGLKDKPFTIVIDPGHGGIDGGARGVSGTLEKVVTLEFAIELKKKFEAIEKIRVFLTRESDKFLRLRQRVGIARQYEADLFISIHADTIRFRGVRGATVYTVSEKASDEVAQSIANSENLADQLAGITPEETDHEVTDILLDLLRKETQTFSIRFARSLIGEMSQSVELIKNPHRFAGFQVLTAPDVPSVLLELGYLSNRKDEALLRDPKWRAKAEDSVVSAVKKFAQARSGMGG